MSDIEVVIRMGVLAFIAVSGVVRVIAALCIPAVRQSVARHRAAHACWFVVSAVAFLLLLRPFFPPRKLIHLSSAANALHSTPQQRAVFMSGDIGTAAAKCVVGR